MRIELRSNGSVHVEGYVNAVCRDSRPMPGKDGKYFVEQIEAGVFKRAIAGGGVIPMHNHERVIVPYENFVLREDAIGLYASFDTSDPIIREKAEKKEFRGWSFGFSKARERWEPRSDGCSRRYISDLTLHEISLVDSAQLPCYAGTTVEVRSEAYEGTTDDEKEMRAFECETQYIGAEDEEPCGKSPKDEAQPEKSETNTTDELRAEAIHSKKIIEILSL